LPAYKCVIGSLILREIMKTYRWISVCFVYMGEITLSGAASIKIRSMYRQILMKISMAISPEIMISRDYRRLALLFLLRPESQGLAHLGPKLKRRE
jgi:hypothetical protein